MASNLVQVNWETQKKVLFSSIGSFRSKEIHTDVTLSCEGENFLAHRLILSMCSGYFKKALHNSTSSSLVVMFGVRKTILEALLNFVYDGTTTVRTDDIPELLNAGKRLEIPGLMDMGNSGGNFIGPKRNNGSEVRRATSSAFSRDVRNSSEGMDFTRNSSEGNEFTRNSSEGNDFARNSSEGNDFARISSERNDFSKKVIKTEFDYCSPEKKILNAASENVGSFKDHVPVENRDFLFASDAEGDVNSNHGAIGNQNRREQEMAMSHKVNGSSTKSFPSMKRKHECPICGKKFSRLLSLQDHIELHDAHASTIYPCNHCGKKFGSERVYVTHVRKCATDSARSQSVSLTPDKNGKRSHGGQSQSSCMNKRNRNDDDDVDDYENDDYDNDDDDNENEKVGSGDQSGSSTNGNTKPNAIALKKSVATLNNRYCTLCSQIFPTILKYKNHKKTDCKMLECQFCLQEFELEKKTEYLRHVSIHKGKNPYSCPKCEFVTSTEISLENHVALLHTGIYRFWCPLCDFQAMKFHELRAHSKSEHPDVLNAD